MFFNLSIPKMNWRPKMKIKALFLGVAHLLLCSFAIANVTVYRATDRKNATYAKVADGQWRIDEDGLSTFELANFNVTNKACQITFVIQNVTSQPDPGTRGQVQNMAAGYIGVYTPEHGGVGHWSIQPPHGTSNAAFQAAVTAYVIAHGATGVNANYTGSNPSLCQTPAAAN
jgi:hypothetical protein